MDSIVKNSKARRDFTIEETFEAGLVLTGTEVKSLRAGHGQISESFARVEKDEVWLYNSYIEEYEQGNRENHDPSAKRKLLLNRSEIRKIAVLTETKGFTLVPLSLYWKNGRVKLSLGVGKGKEKGDKRQDVKKRDVDREMRRATMQRSKGA